MSDPVDRVDRGRGEGEKTNDADKHFGQKREIRRKSMVGEDDGGKHDLGDRVGFADRARTHRNWPVEHPCQHDAADDEQIAADNEDREPSRKLADDGEGYLYRVQLGLVGVLILISPEPRTFIEVAGD
jgi:hypothetical protein